MKKRYKHSLSYYRLLTCNMGLLIPAGVVEVLPGDTFQHSTSLFMRLSPLVTPPMHPVVATIHQWYVPFRLVWDNFESFITGGEDGLDTHTVPVISIPTTGVTSGSLMDYFGVPIGPIPAPLPVSALVMRAYRLIFKEWYRDEDLVTKDISGDIDTGDGPDSSDFCSVLPFGHAWAKDYFTSASPWPQKGPGITVPVQGATINPPQIGVTLRPSGEGIGPRFIRAATSTYTGNLGARDDCGEGASSVILGDGPVGSNDYRGLGWDPTHIGLTADVDYKPGASTMGSIDINQLREAFALQRFEEHRALYGSRYTEYLRYLGVRASDARLQRPEYLGGGRQTIQFSEVLQTEPVSTSPAGTMAGHGIMGLRTPRYRRFFEEHGLVISLLHVQPLSIYMQSLPRMWSRRTKEDFWQHELEHIGEQEILNKELYMPSSEPDGVFGYQARYDEYRSHESTVTGEFRTVLKDWHFAREFSNQPNLNSEFVYGAPTRRPFAAQQNDVLYCMIHHSIQARRLVSKRGNPI